MIPALVAALVVALAVVVVLTAKAPGLRAIVERAFRRPVHGKPVRADHYYKPYWEKPKA